MRLLLITWILLLVAAPASGDCGWVENSPDCIPGRSFVDRLDVWDAYQIHIIYAIPADGDDQEVDVNGAIGDLITWGNDWFANQTQNRVFEGGQRFRYDLTAEGDYDITFVRLAGSEAFYSQKGVFIRDELEAELHDLGFRAQDKIYAVIFGGRKDGKCTGGGGAHPPNLPGNVAAIYIGNASCPYIQRLNREYSRVAMIHEIIHTLGFVADCANWVTRKGHTTVFPDLMWAGEGQWDWSAVDDQSQVYYAHGNPDCPLDLAASAFLEPAVNEPQLPPGWEGCGYMGYGRRSDDPNC